VSDVCQEYFQRKDEDGRNGEMNDDWIGLTVMVRDSGKDGKDLILNLMCYYVSTNFLKLMMHGKAVAAFCLYARAGRGERCVGWTLHYKPEGRGFDSRWCHWNFLLTSFRSHCGPGVDSSSNRNEYQECFMRTADNLTAFMCRLS
jgi:hypothetical protein